MDALNTNTLIAVGVVAVILVAVVAWLAWSSHQTRRLRDRFGPEYDAVLKRHGGSKAKAEAELRRRQKRVEHLEIVALSPQHIAIRRHDPQAGEVVVHFPRAGFMVFPA